MQHHPIGSFDWKRIIKRAELPRTTKLIASFLGDFANLDGSNAHPGVLLLAQMAGVTDRTVKTHLKVLREAGLIEKTKHSRMLGQADVYCLTVPAADHAPVPMRLDPDGERLDTVLKATVAVTDAAEPVDNAVDNCSERASETGSYMKLDAVLSEAGRRSRGSWLHPTNQTNHYQPFPGLPQASNSPAADPANDHGGLEAKGGCEPNEAESTAARELLNLVPDIGPVMVTACAELAAIGIIDPEVRQVVVRAAGIATRPGITDEHWPQPSSAAGAGHPANRAGAWTHIARPMASLLDPATGDHVRDRQNGDDDHQRPHRAALHPTRRDVERQAGGRDPSIVDGDTLDLLTRVGDLEGPVTRLVQVLPRCGGALRRRPSAVAVNLAPVRGSVTA